MAKQELMEQEWSHFFDVDDLEKSKALTLTIEASEEEREDLARRFDVVSIYKTQATLTISRTGGNIIHIKGDSTCHVTQHCVVTMDLIETKINEPVEGWFADKETMVSFAAAKKERAIARSQAEVEILEEKDDPEPIIDGRIDLGELVAQHISLAIPLYPHKEGVKFEVTDEHVTIDDKSPLRKNPFEALKDWKENR